MKRKITTLESNYLKEDNNKRLLFDFFGDAVFTALTCEQLAAINASYNDSTIILLALSVLGAYVCYNDTQMRYIESINLNNDYSELYSESEGMKLTLKK